jgi:arsenate reductase (thioredoxin)
MSNTILFLCPHHAAKSVIAAAYFNQIADQLGLALKADSAGTEPDDVVSPVVVAMLSREGIDVSQHQPRLVTAEELATAQRIISMGCLNETLAVAPERIEQWNDLPMVSQDPDGARIAIRTRVEQLITELQPAK